MSSSDMEYQFITDNKEAEKAADFLSSQSRIAYDIEGTGLKIVGKPSKILLMQLGTQDMSYVFDARKVNPQILKPVLESTSILKIIHNAKYEYQMTKVNTGIVVDNVFDTMLAYRLLTSGLIEDKDENIIPAGFRDKSKKQFPYKGLNFCTQRFLGITLDKSVREGFIDMPEHKEFTKKEIEYAAEDVYVLHPLCDLFSAQLMEQGLIDTALLEFEFVAPVSEMEMAGICIDTGQWRSIIAQAKQQAKQFEAQMAGILAPLSEQNTLFGKSTININSPEQLLRVFKKLGFDIEDTESDTLKKIPHPLAKLLQQYKAYDKLVSTYGESFLQKINPYTRRLHFTLHQLGADTGRLASEKPNIQNIPNDKEDEAAGVEISFRDCFVAAEGTSILTADYSQCELRILAEMSQDAKFLDIFARDLDLHIITSQQVFGYSDEELATYKATKKALEADDSLDLSSFPAEAVAAYKKVGDFRSKTKAVNFGIAYGLSAFALSDQIKVSMKEAEDILNLYFKTYSGIKRWLDKNAHETVVNRYAKTILGRKKYFHLAPPHDEEAFKKSRGATRRMGNNHVIQGCNADITKKAIIALHKAYKEIPGAKLLFTVHDEIVSECRKEDGPRVAALKADIMRDAFHHFIKTVPVGPKDKVTVKIADRWAK